ncbi:MAG: hypothetical protein WCD89_03180 [Anaerocolumna sp.]
MSEALWWKEPMRVIQFNLQVMDTPGMDPAKIAQETEDLQSFIMPLKLNGKISR